MFSKSFGSVSIHYGRLYLNLQVVVYPLSIKEQALFAHQILPPSWRAGRLKRGQKAPTVLNPRVPQEWLTVREKTLPDRTVRFGQKDNRKCLIFKPPPFEPLRCTNTTACSTGGTCGTPRRLCPSCLRCWSPTRGSSSRGMGRPRPMSKAFYAVAATSPSSINRA